MKWRCAQSAQSRTSIEWQCSPVVLLRAQSQLIHEELRAVFPSLR
jgi:hypothetical protein